MAAEAPLLVFENYSLSEAGPVMNLEIYPGDAYALMGPSCSGKSRLLEQVESWERPAQGRLILAGQITAVPVGAHQRRRSPQGIARAVLGKGHADRVGHLLSGLGLWEVRQEPISQMTPSQALACDLFGVLLKPADLVLVDGHLDAFDPWTLESVLETLEGIQRDGQALLVATNRSEIANQLGNLIVLNSQSPVFVGTVQELLNSCAPTELLVETDDESAVRSVAEPFNVRIEQTEEGLRLEATEDQELAARLLSQGYGVIRSVVVRRPTLEEALKSLG